MSNNSSDKTMFAMRIDKNEKEQLRHLYHDMGLDLSTAVNLFFKQSLLEEGLPFQPKRKKFPAMMIDQPVWNFSFRI
ncbi:type II toxin-antitoxin system RelB/DinJ family antitoxin [Lactiplantibacillus plantarum]|uniref:type II toxin-antitoxin system RelB/DinJ family antitoxin n=2 Tax=Lactiplantibacillus plantarum TaxID=1590 RepID=UPI00280C19E0|nr:type II toxin-antitoxin system RelB/DinJ family antitoxin [Lactiplantibacillus plantarum]